MLFSVAEVGLMAGENFPIPVWHLNSIPNAGIGVFSAFHVVAASCNPSFAHTVVWIAIKITIQPAPRKEYAPESWCSVVNGASANTTVESPVVSSMMPTSSHTVPHMEWIDFLLDCPFQVRLLSNR